MNDFKKNEQVAAATLSCPVHGAYVTDPQISDAGKGVVLESDLDRRTYQWLLATFGAEAIAIAISGLKGARRPYVSNIVKALGAKVPHNVIHPISDEARAALHAVRQRLAAKAHK